MQSVALAKQTLPPFRPNVLRAGWLKDLETNDVGVKGADSGVPSWRGRNNWGSGPGESPTFTV